MNKVTAAPGKTIDSDGPRSGAVALGWWSRCLDADNGAARAARARLKRAASPADVLALDITHELYRELRRAKDGRDLRKGDGPVRLALITAALGSVETHTGGIGLARRFGAQSRDERPALSPMRFQRILRAPDDWALAVLIRRALPLAGRTADVAGLGSDLFHWSDRVRNRWCFEYFGTSPPRRPSDDADPAEIDETESA